MANSKKDSEARPRVMLVEDLGLLRESLRMAFEADGRTTVVAEAGDGQEAIERARETRPDVILMDIHMPVMDGVEATRRILSELPDVKVLVLSSSAAEPDVLEAFKEGAKGYLLKDSSRTKEIITSTIKVHEGESAIDPQLAALLVQEYRRLRTESPSEKSARLSELEDKVLNLRRQGMDMKDIARKLNISERKVHSLLGAVHTKYRRHEL